MFLNVSLWVFLVILRPSQSKFTYFNLENTYGPYCNADNIYTPIAGVVRYAGTPWTGRCQLNLRSCCSPVMSNKTFATRFYVYLMKPPTCLTEIVTIESNSGEKVVINCQSPDGSEYFFDADKLTIVYERSEKFPLSKFSMIVTPLKWKSRMYTSCGFDCFNDTYCIDRSLVCDRYRNCPNHIDEAQCDYHTQRKPMSFRSKLILLIFLLTIISFDVCSILICYFCCGVRQENRLSVSKQKNNSKSTAIMLEEGAATTTPLLESNPSQS